MYNINIAENRIEDLKRLDYMLFRGIFYAIMTSKVEPPKTMKFGANGNFLKLISWNSFH